MPNNILLNSLLYYFDTNLCNWVITFSVGKLDAIPLEMSQVWSSNHKCFSLSPTQALKSTFGQQQIFCSIEDDLYEEKKPCKIVALPLKRNLREIDWKEILWSADIFF